jgi:hypothetical protein
MFKVTVTIVAIVVFSGAVLWASVPAFLWLVVTGKGREEAKALLAKSLLNALAIEREAANAEGAWAEGIKQAYLRDGVPMSHRDPQDRVPGMHREGALARRDSEAAQLVHRFAEAQQRCETARHNFEFAETEHQEAVAALSRRLMLGVGAGLVAAVLLIAGALALQSIK